MPDEIRNVLVISYLESLTGGTHFSEEDRQIEGISSGESCYGGNVHEKTGGSTNAIVRASLAI